MYSVVLMLALSGGAEATEARCCGCTGYVSSCCGRTHHNRCHGCSGGLFSRGHGCSGCSGYSRCHGHSRCHGCSGGFFTCSGCTGYSACSGCYGSCHGRRHGHRNRCCGCTGYVVACCGTTVAPTVVPGAVPPPPAKMPPAVPPPPPAKTDASAPATIVVSLPADARLTVDGVATTSTSDRRVLVTPSLEQGEFVYTLRAEVVRNGQTVAQTQNVTVRPGQTTEVPFSFATEGVASR